MATKFVNYSPRTLAVIIIYTSIILNRRRRRRRRCRVVSRCTFSFSRVTSTLGTYYYNIILYYIRARHRRTWADGYKYDIYLPI